MKRRLSFLTVPAYMRSERAAYLYAAYMSQLTGVPRRVIRSDAQSRAFEMGIRFGIIAEQEVPAYEGYVLPKTP